MTRKIKVRCARCHSAVYCDKACQRKHWFAKTGTRHKDECSEELQAELQARYREKKELRRKATNGGDDGGEG